MKKCACRGAFLDKLVQPTILMFLYRQPLHGFSILKEMEKTGVMDHSSIDPTGLYRTLKKMEAAGLLVSNWDVNNHAQPRKIYAITEDGKDCLKHWKTTLFHYKNSIDHLVQAISETLDADKSI